MIKKQNEGGDADSFWDDSQEKDNSENGGTRKETDTFNFLQ